MREDDRGRDRVMERIYEERVMAGLRSRSVIVSILVRPEIAEKSEEKKR